MKLLIVGTFQVLLLQKEIRFIFAGIKPYHGDAQIIKHDDKYFCVIQTIQRELVTTPFIMALGHQI